MHCGNAYPTGHAVVGQQTGTWCLTMYKNAHKRAVANTMNNMEETTTVTDQPTPAQKKPRRHTRANTKIPGLPREIWCYILQIRARKMWFESKVMAKIKEIEYHIVEQCNLGQHSLPLGCVQLSTATHEDKKVTYRLNEVWTIANFGAPVGKTTGLVAQRVWLVRKFQTLFKTSCSMQLVDLNMVACPNWDRTDGTCKCQWHYGHPPRTGPVWNRAVRVELGVAVGCLSFPKPTIHGPKQLRPVMA